MDRCRDRKRDWSSPRGFLLTVPNQLIPPLVFKALCAGRLSPRTAGGGGKSRDPRLWNGAETVATGSGNSGAESSPGGLRGGEAETTPSYFPDVISWEESELAASEQRDSRIPPPDRLISHYSHRSICLLEVFVDNNLKNTDGETAQNRRPE